MSLVTVAVLLFVSGSNVDEEACPVLVSCPLHIPTSAAHVRTVMTTEWDCDGAVAPG